MEKDNKILDRIRKLLALAVNNPNEHEAASAAERAQTLLAEYNVTMEDVRAADVSHVHDPEFEFDDTIRTLSRPWRRALGTMVAKLYFCNYFYTFHYHYVPRSKRKCGYIRYDIHNFVGERHNIEVAKLIYQYLCDTIDRIAKDEQKRRKASVSFYTSFQHGCANRLCVRINDRIIASKAGQVVSSTGTALMLVDAYDKAEQLTGEAIKKKLGQELSASREVSYLDGEGWRAGRDAAEKISLDTQITEKKPAKQIGVRS